MRYEIWDTAENDFLDEYPDEAAARAGLEQRLRRAVNPRNVLRSLKVQKRFENDAVEIVEQGLSLAIWVAFGSTSRPEDTVTVTETATDDQVAFLLRRQQSLIAETMKLSMIYAVMLSLVLGFVFGYGAGSAIVGLMTCVLVAVFIIGIGFSISWARRERMRVEARRGSVTIKRGPFVVAERPPPAHVGGESRYVACFADGQIDVPEVIAVPLMDLGAVLSATVVLFPETGQILEVRGADDNVLFRHPDYRPMGARASEPS